VTTGDDNPHAANSADEARDRVTLSLLIADHPDGLRRLLIDHGGTVRNGLRRMFGRALDASDLDDAIGTAIANIWQARLTFDPSHGTLRAWLFVIARNCALNLLATRRVDTVSIEDIHLLMPDLRCSVAEAERLRLSLDVQRCLASMPARMRTVLNADLAAGGTAPTPALAQRLGTTIGTIYVARSRGRLILRQELHRLGYMVEAPRRTQPHFDPSADPEPRLG
jgi:RNA polymerase sigma factor (sigma-70 family)